jgi:hypothetical protein
VYKLFFHLPNLGITKPNVPEKKSEKRKVDPRSSLVDMEHAEHTLRLKKLQVEYEESLVRKEIAQEEKVYRAKLHQLQLKKLQLEIDQVIGDQQSQ